MTPALTADLSTRSADDVSLFATFSRQPMVELNQSAIDGNLSLPAFYCVHSISGNACKHYKLLAKKLNHVVRFYGIQAPQYKIKSTTFGDCVDEIVEFYTDALLKAQPTGGFLLGGYSAGSLIALEIAQRLRLTHKREVDLLVSIDGTFETLHADFHPRRGAYAWGVLRNLPAWITGSLLTRKMPLYSRLKQITSIRTILSGNSIIKHQTSANDTHHPVEGFEVYQNSPAFLRHFMVRLYNALIAYEHENYYGEVVVYEATATRLLNLSSVGKAWSAKAQHAKIVRISGSHATILYEPHVSKLANDLTSRLVPLRTG